MPKNNGAKGACAEREFMELKRAEGYECIRAAGSHGPGDIWATNGKELLIIQCKSGKAKPGRALREALRSWKAEKLPACKIPIRMIISFREDRKGWKIEEVE